MSVAGPLKELDTSSQLKNNDCSYINLFNPHSDDERRCSNVEVGTTFEEDISKHLAKSSVRFANDSDSPGASDGRSADSNPKEQINSVKSKPEPPFNGGGIIATVASSFCFASSILCVKLQASSNSPAEKVQSLLASGVIVTLLSGLTAICQRSSLKVHRSEIKSTLARSVFGCVLYLLAYMSLRYIPPGESSALRQLSPLWTSLLAYGILGEPLHWIVLLMLPVSMVGVILIAQPDLVLNLPANVEYTWPIDAYATSDGFEYRDYSSETESWKGIILGILAGVSLSLQYISLRCRKKTTNEASLFWFGVLTLIFSLVIMLLIGFGDMPTALEWALLVLGGCFLWCGQFLMTWALFYESASTVSIIRTLDVAFSFCLSRFFLEDEILWTSVLGGVIICAVVVIAITHEQLKELILSRGFYSISR